MKWCADQELFFRAWLTLAEKITCLYIYICIVVILPKSFTESSHRHHSWLSRISIKPGYLPITYKVTNIYWFWDLQEWCIPKHTILYPGPHLNPYFCSCPGILLPPFLTCVNVPPENHLSFAACTFWAAEREGVTISRPWTGVNDKEVAIPLAASLDVTERPRSWVRSLLARESLAN